MSEVGRHQSASCHQRIESFFRLNQLLELLSVVEVLPIDRQGEFCCRILRSTVATIRFDCPVKSDWATPCITGHCFTGVAFLIVVDTM